METITIKINERSKAGKMVKDFLELIPKNPGVEILEEKDEYNPKFVAKVLKSAASKNRTRIDTKKFMGKYLIELSGKAINLSHSIQMVRCYPRRTIKVDNVESNVQ